MDNLYSAMSSACRDIGVLPPDSLPTSGKWEEADIEGDPHGKGDGRIKLFLDGAGGIVHNWKSGKQDTFFTNSNTKLTPDQRAARHQAVEIARIRAEEDLLQEREKAALKAKAIYDAGSKDIASHPYALHKKVGFGPLVRRGAWPQRGWTDAILIPIYNADGKLRTLEAINTDGTKDFLKNGEKRGCFYPLGKIRSAKRAYIGEGLATVAVCAKDGTPAVAAMDAGNLMHVAKEIRKIAPDAEIIFLTDNDIKPDGSNPGLTYATAAAIAVGGKVAIPEMGKPCDFWNLWHEQGVEAVQQAIAGAKAPAIPTHQEAKEKAAAGDSGCWQTIEPEPLRAQLPPAEQYPVDSLGAVLGDAAQALHDTVKAPLAMCCQSVLAAASLAAQAHFDVKLPWGEKKPLSLFMLTVGESGERKSGIDDLVLGAAKTQERADMEIYHANLKTYETELASWTHAADAARRAVTSGKKSSSTASEVREAVDRCGNRPEAPIAPLRFVSDPTVEGLYKLLAGGQPNVALFSDEGGLLIGGHALNSDNALKTMARWCKLWDGSPFDRVRAGDGAGVLYGRRMALHQLAQPDVMTTLLSDRMANGQGLLARCLVAWPQSTIGERHIERFEWAGERREVKRLYAVLKGLLEAQPSIGNSPQELAPIELPLSEAAKQMAVAAGNQFESLMAKGADLSELRDRTSKALENACRIAGVLTVIDHGLTARQIEADHLARALVLVQWYLKEALRIRGAAAIPQAVIDAEMLSAWLKEKGTSNFRTKKVLNSGPSQLRNKARLMAAIRELVQCGYLIENDSGTVVDGVTARASWQVMHHVV